MHLPVTGRPAKGSGRREKEGTARAARCPGKVRDSTGRTGPRVGGARGHGCTSGRCAHCHFKMAGFTL